MAVVYVIAEHRSKHRSVSDDLMAVSKLSEFGEVRFCLGRDARPSFDPEGTRQQLHQALREFDARRDYIVWLGGDATAMFLLGTLLGEGRDAVSNKVTFLRYEWGRDANGARDARASRYVPFVVDLAA